jgi:general secretion pathway protein D
LKADTEGFNAMQIRQSLIRHRLMPGIVVAALFTALLAGHPVTAQTQTTAAPSNTVTMNMRDADIRTLIQWIADQTGKNMVVHRDVQGKVNVLSAKPVTREEAYRIFLSVLQVHGFAAIETPEAVKIVPANIATQGGVPQRNSDSDDMIVQVFKVTNVAATDLAQMLKPLASKEAVINADASTNMLLVADHANNVAQLQNLVLKLDRSGSSEVELVHLQHANSKQVVSSLSTLFPNQSQSNGGGGMPGQSNSLPLSISADERSNSILLSGDPSKRAQVRRLIQQMDTEISGSGDTLVVYLQYASAKEVVPILKSIAQSVLKDQKDKETSFSIDASESANAVVINAPPGLSNSLKNVVEKLDVRRAQVLVEALIVEVNSDISNELGIIWGTSNVNDLHGSGAVAGVNALGTLDLLGSAKGFDADGKLGDIAAPASGFTLGYYTGGNLQAAIRALSANTKANIISTPTIVAIDNEAASLLVGQNIPLKTGQQTSAASSTANPFVTIERKDIGTSLQITPRINQGNTLTLDLKQKVESVTNSVTGASDLVTNKREINTKVLMRDDQILVLGGLISDEQTGSKQKVPILGDLPLIGKLFSSDSTKHTKNNLMVFIHPVILRDDERARQVSQDNYEYMQRAQEKSLQPPPPTTEKNPPQPAKLQDFDVFSPVRAKP